eukprot:TRINITY_DN13564_c0_g1_i2.p3 TRINITY_DN13564_c0_g1~~TRINITY_DN13564_c0_g1_i2.p3  ORF type:complete len:166 (-),score=8.83 TRINITY_DN13564_c0_g1_i2:51-548(-)
MSSLNQIEIQQLNAIIKYFYDNLHDFNVQQILIMCKCLRQQDQLDLQIGRKIELQLVSENWEKQENLDHLPLILQQIILSKVANMENVKQLIKQHIKGNYEKLSVDGLISTKFILEKFSDKQLEIELQIDEYIEQLDIDTLTLEQYQKFKNILKNVNVKQEVSLQ